MKAPPTFTHRSREPKSAVPTRTCVEPSSTATSKSWLIPMESSGKRLPKRSASRSRISLSRRKYGRAPSGSVGEGRHGHEAADLEVREVRARRAASASTSSAGAPDLVSSPPRLTSRRTGNDRFSAASSPSRRTASRSRSRLSITEKHCSAGFALFVWSGPISRHSRPGNSPRSASIFPTPSATRFSPKSVRPARAACAHDLGGVGLGDGEEARRPPGRARRARRPGRSRPRISSRRAAISAAERVAHEARAPRSLASAPRLASRSAFLFCSRGTWRIEKRRKRLARRTASETSGIRCAALTLKMPLTCCDEEEAVREDLDRLARPAPRRASARGAARGTRRRCWSPCRAARTAPRPAARPPPRCRRPRPPVPDCRGPRRRWRRETS